MFLKICNPHPYKSMSLKINLKNPYPNRYLKKILVLEKRQLKKIIRSSKNYTFSLIKIFKKSHS